MVRRKDWTRRKSPRYVAGTPLTQTNNPVDSVRVTRGSAMRAQQTELEQIALSHILRRHPVVQHPQRLPQGLPPVEVEPPKRLRRILKSLPLPAPPASKRRWKRRRKQQLMYSAARKRRDAKALLRTPVLTSKAMNFMRRLHIAYLPPHCNWCQLKCLLRLNWTIHLESSENSLFQPRSPTVDDATVANNPILPDHILGTASYQSRFPALNVPPTHSPATILNQQFLRRYRRFDRGYIEIPTSWTPIQNLRSYDLRDVLEGPRKSPSTGDETLVDLPVADISRLKSEEECDQTPSKTVDSHSLSVTEPQDGTIAEPQSMSDEQRSDPLALNGRDEPPTLLPYTSFHSPPENRHDDNVASPTEALPEDDGDDGSGRSDVIRHPRSLDSDDTSTATPSTPRSPYRTTTISFIPKLHHHMNVIYDWEMAAVMDPQSFGWRRQDPDILQYRERTRHTRSLLPTQNLLNLDLNPSRVSARFLSLYREDLDSASEAGIDQLMGGLLGDVMSTASISAHYSFRKFTLPGWHCPVSPVKLDVGFIPTNEALPWDRRATPLLLAAQFSDGHYGQDRKAAEILACALHPTMILLILHYLDTRSRIEDNLPPWMIIYGIVYTTSGFSIHEHYPDFRPAVAGATARWTSASRWRLKLEYNSDTPPADRGQSLAALLRISGHTQFVLENLRKWDGYQRIIKPNFFP